MAGNGRILVRPGGRLNPPRVAEAPTHEEVDLCDTIAAVVQEAEIGPLTL